MTYRIIGVDDYHIVLEFRKNNQEIKFDSYESAQKYLKYIESEKVIPSQYELLIKD